jgi:hypothetical protein
MEKPFPRIQIFAALSFLVDDENEYITDKYKRKGRLINIDNYYLFQPEELSNPNISVFDRTVQIDFKRTMIPIVFIDSRSKEKEKKERDQEIGIGDEDVINLMKPEERNQFEKVFRYLSQEKQFQITEEEKRTLMLHHVIESLGFEEKLKIMKIVLPQEGDGNIVKQYFMEKKIGNFYMLNDKFVCKFLDDNLTVMDDGIEPPRFQKAMQQKYKVETFPFNLNIEKVKEKKKANKKEEDDRRKIRQTAAENFSVQFGDYVGFMSNKKQTKGGDFDEQVFFKFKQHDSLFTIAMLGQTCTEGILNPERIQILNVVLEKLDKSASLFSINDVKAQGKQKKVMLSKEDLCLILELFLRLCELRKLDNKIWFLTPELALYFDLYRG